MNNLKYAKRFLAVGILVGLSLPISVMYNQTVQATKRKKNILIDQERMRTKLKENPSLKYHTTLSTLPINQHSFEELVDQSSGNN